ncbi:MAG: hypothetical protein NTW30_04515 [Candidatus Aenigmarchaeota archaeon]|nr:hypothetical protein [Candidatus Aenigmarchaeota archaeon]
MFKKINSLSIVISFFIFLLSLYNTKADKYLSDWNITVNLSTFNDEITGLAVDSNNNIIVSGFGRTSFTDGYWNISKFNSTGYYLWSYKFDGNYGDDQASVVAVDNQDNFVVAGYERVSPASSPSNYSWRIMKFDSSTIPTQIWNITYNITLNSDKPLDLAIDNDNNITVVGYYNPKSGDYGWHIVKFGNDSTYLWNRSFNFSSGIDQAYGVATDNDNNITVVGLDRLPDGNNEWRIMKFDKYGNSFWNRTVNFSTNGDQAYDVAIDHDNNIIVVGFDKSRGSSNDQWRIMKLDKENNIIWNTSYDLSPAGDTARAVTIDRNSNNITVVGYNYSTDYGWYVMRIGANDNATLWTYYDNPSPSSDQTRSVVVDHNNDIIIGGYVTLLNPNNYAWRIMKFKSVRCGNGRIESTDEECDYMASNPHAPCQPFERCDNTCQCVDFRPNMFGCRYFDYCENGLAPNDPTTLCSSNWDYYCHTEDPSLVTLIQGLCEDSTWVNHSWMTCPNGIASCGTHGEGNGICETGESHTSCPADCP